MKRDMELVRKILLFIEENHICDSQLNSQSIRIDGFSEEQSDYHVKIMVESGLIDARQPKMIGRLLFLIDGLTWYGHEFLDAVRDEGVWNHTKKALSPIGSASFDVVKSVAVAYISSKLGLQR